MATILIIEDEIVVREEVMEWLRLEGHDPIGAGDGIEGVNLAQLYLPDMILCDISMPRLDGYGVMSELRANFLTQLIPFVYITARVSHEDIRQGMILGADDYITKPFTRLELLQSVRACLEKRAILEQRHQVEVEQWREALQEEHEQRLFKAKMVAMFSHDFRNPLATIMSSNSILRSYGSQLTEERRMVHFGRIEGSARQLIQMLEDLLVIAQLETGSLQFKPEELNVTEFLQQIFDEFQSIYGETHTLVFNCDITDTVMFDPRLLRQIAANLISNAIKYSPNRSEVAVSLKTVNQNIVFTVRDHGIGIPEAEQSRLFSAFQRASNVGEISGTGLGLAIVQQATTMHGGTIQLESQVGAGTTVTVYIPC